MTTTRNEYREGVAIRIAGGKRSDNPYHDPRTRAHVEWQNGYDDTDFALRRHYRNYEALANLKATKVKP